MTMLGYVDTECYVALGWEWGYYKHEIDFISVTIILYT